MFLQTCGCREMHRWTDWQVDEVTCGSNMHHNNPTYSGTNGLQGGGQALSSRGHVMTLGEGTGKRQTE